jgi:sterol 3beta-glucosyltransferase
MLGVMDIVQSIHEGFYNMPKLYGSEVREHGKVTNFTSGIKEGSKGLFYGYYDGITGLIREPLKGAKEEVRDAFTNSFKQYVNSSSGVYWRHQRLCTKLLVLSALALKYG